MSLPALIEVIPPSRPVNARITVPGSKSITNRALILAALSGGRVVLKSGLWSEDTQVMVQALVKLGIEVEIEQDPLEPANRHFTVRGGAGKLADGGPPDNPMELFVGNAGTAARFLSAMVCLGRGHYRLSGINRMHERPQDELFRALRDLGYHLQETGGTLPVVVRGGGAKPGARCRVGIEKSSQFTSALLLSAARGGWQVKVMESASDEAPYVKMTEDLIRHFPMDGGLMEIEPDASSGSYFYGARAVLQRGKAGLKSDITVAHWPGSGLQIDAQFPNYMNLPESVSRERDLGDSIMTAMVMAPLEDHPVRFMDLGRLRLQECERVKAMKCELEKCGGKVIEEGDSLSVFPSKLHGAQIETYNDHRMAMCFAVLGLAIEGIKIQNPTCIKKTFPNFFQKLADPQPLGLGVEIVDEKGRLLHGDRLHADE